MGYHTLHRLGLGALVVSLALTVAACGHVEQPTKNAVNTLGQEWSQVGERAAIVEVNLRGMSPTLREAEKSLNQIGFNEADSAQAARVSGTLGSIRQHMGRLRKLETEFRKLKAEYVEVRTAYNEFQTEVNNDGMSNSRALEQLETHRRRYNRLAKELLRTADELQKTVLAYNQLVNQLALEQKVFSLDRIDWKELQS